MKLTYIICNSFIYSIQIFFAIKINHFFELTKDINFKEFFFISNTLKMSTKNQTNFSYFLNTDSKKVEKCNIGNLIFFFYFSSTRQELQLESFMSKIGLEEKLSAEGSK